MTKEKKDKMCTSIYISTDLYEWLRVYSFYNRTTNSTIITSLIKAFKEQIEAEKQ